MRRLSGPRPGFDAAAPGEILGDAADPLAALVREQRRLSALEGGAAHCLDDLRRD